MTKPMIRIHDISTNEITDREMTDEEFAQYEADIVRVKAQQEEQAAKDLARQAALDKLGLTAEEVSALLG